MFDKLEKEKIDKERNEKLKELSKSNPDYYRLFRGHQQDEPADFEIKLYRRDYQGPGKQPKKFLRRYVNLVPLEEEIGKEWGGGSYWLTYFDENQVEDFCYLSIDESYSEDLEKRKQMNLPQQIQQPDPLMYTSKIMTDIIKPMMDLTVSKNMQQQNPTKIIEGMVESFAKGLIRIENAVITKKLDDINRKPAIQRPDQYAWVKEVLEFAKPFLGSFLNAKGKSSEWMKNILVKDPRFQKIQEDDVAFNFLYTLGCQDPDIGLDKMNQLFEKAGFEIPDPSELGPEEEEEPEEEQQEETEEEETQQRQSHV